MNEFGTKAYSLVMRWLSRFLIFMLFGMFVFTWVVLMRWWDQLDIVRVYVYFAIFVAYIIIERRAFRGPDEAAYSEQMWVRYLLTYSWWFLMLGSLLEHALTQRDIPALSIVGAVISLVGVVIGYWSTKVLRDEMGERVETWANLRIVQAGPYAVIRHPAYAANILLVIGMPLLMNAFYALILSAILVALFIRRLIWEERILASRLPEYAEYMQRSDSLIPRVW